MKLRSALAAAPIALALTLSACGSDSSSDSAASAADSSSVAASETTMTAATMDPDTTAATAAQADFNDADVMFAQNMIPHHQQAVEMATIALDPARQASAEVKDLATRIQGAQDPEIELLTGWLAAWGQPVDGSTGSDGMEGMDHSDMTGMAGMMSQADMDSLDAATGAEFDKLWMTMMIAHHEGAIEMSKTEQSNGQNVPAKELAGKIITAQQGEIAEMKTLLG